jgi:acyl carrier protein
MMSKEKINKIIADHLGIDVSVVTGEKGIESDLGADSLDHVEIIMAVEEEFEIVIPPDVEDTLVTVSDFHNYVEGVL